MLSKWKFVFTKDLDCIAHLSRFRLAVISINTTDTSRLKVSAMKIRIGFNSTVFTPTERPHIHSEDGNYAGRWGPMLRRKLGDKEVKQDLIRLCLSSQLKLGDVQIFQWLLLFFLKLSS
jgi:hypothetical protein